MAFNVSALSTWVAPGDLFAKALFQNSTFSRVRVEPGVKGSKYINPFSSTANFNAGACSFNATGSTVVSQVLLTVDELSAHETYCVSDFNSYALQKLLKAGSSDHDDLNVVNQFMDEKAQAYSNELAKMFWQAKKVGGTGNLARTNGIIQKIYNDNTNSGITSANTITVTVTSSNAIDTVDRLLTGCSASLFTKQDITVFMTSAVYRLYQMNLKNTNNFSFGSDFNNFETTHPGYPNVKVCGLPELDSNADGVDMILTYASNFVWGLDEVAENTDFEIWYSRDNRDIRSALETKIGTAVLEPALVYMVL